MVALGIIPARRTAQMLMCVCAFSITSLSRREERKILPLDRRHEYGAVEIFVPALARRFRRKQAGVASGGMHRRALLAWCVLGAQRIRGTLGRVAECGTQVP